MCGYCRTEEKTWEAFFSTVVSFPRKSQSSCCSNERWWYSYICYSNTAPNGNLLPTYQNATLVSRSFTIHVRKNVFKAFGDATALSFPVIPECSGLNLYWCQLNSMRLRRKHLWQIIIYWSKSTGGTKHWLHRGTEWWLGAGEDVLLINCRKRTKKMFS